MCWFTGGNLPVNCQSKTVRRPKNAGRPRLLMRIYAYEMLSHTQRNNSISFRVIFLLASHFTMCLDVITESVLFMMNQSPPNLY